MAIFTNDDKQSNGTGNGNNNGGATIIAQGTRIKGDINTDCRLHIDGEFEGNINSKNTVMVGKSGIVKGEITADALLVAGKFLGNCVVNLLELKAQGRIEGTITANEITVERKGVFIGESKIKEPKIPAFDKKSTKI